MGEIMNIETEKFYENIKNKLKDNEYRLGLDLGVGSIGWAILSLKKEGEKYVSGEIVASGSRIFEASAGAEDRRLKRLQRNAHRHKRERLFYLWKFLGDKNLALKAPDKIEKENPLDGDTSKKRFPEKTLKKDPYVLRAKALEEKLELYDLGYVIYHIANHRGTSSVRTFTDDDETKKKEIKELQEKATKTLDLLKNNKYKTYGELIYKEKIKPFNDRVEEYKKNNKKIDFKKVQIRNSSNMNDFIITRDLALKEIREILNKQREFYGEDKKKTEKNFIIDDDFTNKIVELVNFEYEKLVPAPGRCPYFQEEYKLPKSHPLSEERRIWESLNNVRVIEPVLKVDEVISYKERDLTQGEKNKLFEVLKQQKELSEGKIKKLLGYNEKYELTLQGRNKENQKLKGYRNIDLEKMSFWSRLDEEQKDSFFYDWISTVGDDELKNKLQNKYNLSEEEANDALKKVELVKGYSPIGKKATLIINEYIKKGLSFGESIDEAVKDGKISLNEVKIYDTLPYYGEVLSDLTQPVICKALFEKFKNKNYKKPHTDPNEEKWGRIANPVVHQTLNELRKLINEVVKATGKKPCEINLEVARELKKSAEERDYIIREQDLNEKKRDEIYEKYCKGREQLPQNAMLKFRLYEEQDKKCPYCGEIISPDDIYNSRVDIDHIFPISESLDNSRNNMVLSHNTCNGNGEKGKRSPYQAFYGTDRWNTILGYLNECKGMKNKKWRFMEGSYEEFLKNLPIKKRFSSDTSYISKSAARYLSCLFDKKSRVVCYKGGLTAQLRLSWDINGLLVPHIKELLYDQEKETFKKYDSLNIKLRSDHRHHALDAIVLAYADRNYSNLLNRLSAKGHNIDFNEKNWLSKILIPPDNKELEEFKEEILNKIKEIFTSIKQDHNPNGELIKETYYRVYLVNGKYLLCSKKMVKDIKADCIDDIEKELNKGRREIENSENKELKSMFQKNINVLNRIKDNFEIAKTELEKENEKAKENGKKIDDINEKKIIKKDIEITGGFYYSFQPNKEKGKFYILKEPTENKSGCGYDTGENLCLDLYYDKNGKLCGEIIRKIDIMRNLEPEYKKKGYQLFERIYQGDVLECDLSQEKKALSVSSPNAVNKRVFVKVTTFTELPKYYDGKLDQIQIHFINLNRVENKPDDSFYISSMKRYHPRKVVLTSMGAIKYRSKILEDYVANH
jgi:CRISPR-associated endonuclease Csn1